MSDNQTAPAFAITSAQVILGRGPDVIILKTTLPESTWPFAGNACLHMNAASNTGVDYVRRHFDIEAEVISNAN